MSFRVKNLLSQQSHVYIAGKEISREKLSLLKVGPKINILADFRHFSHLSEQLLQGSKINYFDRGLKEVILDIFLILFEVLLQQ